MAMLMSSLCVCAEVLHGTVGSVLDHSCWIPVPNFDTWGCGQLAQRWTFVWSARSLCLRRKWVINSLRCCLKLNEPSFSHMNNPMQSFFCKCGQAFAVCYDPTYLCSSCIYSYDSAVHLGAEMWRTCGESGCFQEKHRLWFV